PTPSQPHLRLRSTAVRQHRPTGAGGQTEGDRQDGRRQYQIRNGRLMPVDLPRRMAAEAAGTAMLVVAVVGSGIMAQNLTHDVALALLANSLATGAILVVLITVLAPLSGAHFNPAVSLVFALRRDLAWTEAGLYAAAQIIGGLFGTLLAHAMFGLPLVEASTRPRLGPGQWLAEVLATFGLLTVILAGVRFRQQAVPWLIGLYITAAYWFTASTSFANPAVAIARAFTDTFAGIRPIDVPGFVVAELAGALLATGALGWLLRSPESEVPPGSTVDAAA